MPAVHATDAPLALTELRSSVCRAASRFDARVLDRDGAAVALAAWTAILHAAQAAFAMAAARVDECGPPPSAGASSASDFVAKQAGITSNKASEAIKTGQGLHKSEQTRVRATDGLLSADQTAAITDALTIAPEAEEKLLDAARHTSVGGLREECAKTKAAHQDMEALERRIHANRRVRRYTDAEGAEHLHAVGTKASMSRLDSALKRLIDERFKEARAEDAREPLEAYAYDSLISLADAPAGDNTDKKVRIRYLGLLRIDWTALMEGETQDDETCEIAGLGPVSVATARELLDESILKLVITKGVDVVNVTHLGRGPNAAQKIALRWRQPICTRQGCGRRARLEDDHKWGFEYAKTKHTRLDETEPMCHDDHELHTLQGWALVEGRGTRPMVPPDDPRHPKNTKPPPDESLP